MKKFIRIVLVCAFAFAAHPGSAKTYEAHKAALERLHLLKQIPAEEYEITLLLDDAMTQIKRGRNLSSFRERLRVARADRSASTDGGGTTIVGSGGDTCELFVKRTLYRLYKDHPYYGPLAFRARVRCQSQCEQIYGRTICKTLMPNQQEIRRRTISGYAQRLRNGVVTITAPDFVGRRDFVEANPWIKEFLVNRFSEL